MSAPGFVPHEGIYLLNHSVGRPPVGARNAMSKGFLEPWEHGDADVWPLWLEQVAGFRQAVARLLNGNPRDICPQVNLSSALGKIIHSLPRTSRKDVILCTEQDFPSMGFVLSRAQQAGYRLRMIPAGEDCCDLEVWQSHLQEDVCCALITQVYSNSSAQLPVDQITRLTRERDIVSIVDSCQAVGVVPVDLQGWQADFVLGSSVKWLCGGPGAGFLWASPDIVQRCQPLDVGWFSHAQPFEFDIHHFQYARDALRFWGGTPSVSPFVLAAYSIGTICDIGVQRIREHNLSLTQTLIDALPPETVVTPRDPAQRGGTLVVNFGDEQARIAARLSGVEVRFDQRPEGLRLSPHIYNTAEEMGVVRDCLTG